MGVKCRATSIAENLTLLAFYGVALCLGLISWTSLQFEAISFDLLTDWHFPSNTFAIVAQSFEACCFKYQTCNPEIKLLANTTNSQHRFHDYIHLYYIFFAFPNNIFNDNKIFCNKAHFDDKHIKETTFEKVTRWSVGEVLQKPKSLS